MQGKYKVQYEKNAYCMRGSRRGSFFSPWVKNGREESELEDIHEGRELIFGRDFKDTKGRAGRERE